MTNGVEQLTTLDRRHVWHPFTQEGTAPDPIPIVSGRGAELHALDGRVFLDLISSWWVTTHGHGHPRVAEAIGRQAAQLEQVIFAGFTHEPAVQLATRLAQLLPDGLERVFFSDNGSTAVEVALKMACQYHLNRGERRTRFITFEGGYHGDTVGAMSAGRTTGFFDAFTPLLLQFDILPFPATWNGDAQVAEREAEALAALDVHLEQYAGECAAVLVEPLMQGASGMRMCRPEFLRQLAQRVRQAGALLIFDEVMTGFGRTGALFACQRAGVTPDLICLSKGLTAGFMPMSVTVAGEAIYQAFLGETFDRAFAHGHSFTANPLGCAAALASLDLFQEEGTMARIATIEAHHQRWLERLAGHPKVRRLRGLGTIAALEVVAERPGYHSEVGPRLKAFFLERGLNLRPLGNVLYLLPPYCISEEQLERGWQGVADALETVA